MPDPTLPRGSTLDRYVILDVLGGGGMGVVYTAYDPKLDRKVAIKLAHQGAIDPESRARLVREAQALARLSHPHVVLVHDVGEQGGQIFVTMEYVQGRTLTRWLEERRRTLKETLRAFREVGEGLSAAHAAGVVHRDFKPDNVIAGDDGRLRVVDFGLAAGESVPSIEQSARSGDGPLTLGTTLPFWRTAVGAVMGTPAYMAPEQWQGLATDARTDQFSFCASLYEALYGELPFAGDSGPALAAQVLQGRVKDAPKSSGVPAWLRAVLLRGLSTRPADRYASMQDLLRALDSRPGAALGRAALALVPLLAIASVAVAYRVHAGRARIACAAAEQGLAGAWDDPARAALSAAFRASDRPYAEAALPKVLHALDDYARGWVKMSRESCEATRVLGEQSEAMLALRAQCLDERKDELGALVKVISTDPRSIEGATRAAARLPGLELCASPEALRARPPVPKGREAEARSLRAALAGVRALDEAGRYPDVIPAAERVAKDAGGLGFASIEAEALRYLGDAKDGVGDDAAAEAALVSAVARAEEARADDVRASALTLLVYVTGWGRGDARRARQWAALAEPALARSGGSDSLRASLLTNLGEAARREGACETAVPLYERALGLLVKRFGPGDAREDAELANIAACHADQGKLDQAEEELHRVLTIEENATGPRHPIVAVTLRSLARVLRMEGRDDEALGLYRRAEAIDVAAVTAGEPTVGEDLAGASACLVSVGRYEEARVAAEKAVELFQRAHAEDEAFARAETSLGLARLGLGMIENAVPPLERALAALGERPGDPVDLAAARFALVRALAALGRDPSRTSRLARQAHDALTRAGPRAARDLSAVEAWLAEHA